MKIDSIVKEELSVSIVNYFFYFLLCIPLLINRYVSIEPQIIFIIVFVFTVIHFLLVVWYRRKEQLFASTFISTVNYLFQSDIYEEKTKELCNNKETSIVSLIKKNIRFLIITIFLYIVYIVAFLQNNTRGRYGTQEVLLEPPIPRIKHITLLLVTVVIYFLYLYASLVYKIDQTYWILVLLIIVGVLLKIICDEKETSQPGSMRLLSFCITVCIFIYVRYLVLGYPLIPI
jgi:hypothetical protein